MSNRTELGRLGDLVEAVQTATKGADSLLIGAMARDLLLHYGHGIDVSRATEDIDIGIVVDDWKQFAEVRQQLLDSGQFMEVPGIKQRLVFEHDIPLDLVPFGGIERKLLTNDGAGPHTAISKLREIIEPQLQPENPGALLREVPAQDIEQFAGLLSSFVRGLAELRARARNTTLESLATHEWLTRMAAIMIHLAFSNA